MACTISVLVVEDYCPFVELIKEHLEDFKSAEFVITHAQRADEAYGLLENGTFDVILLDLTLPDTDGLDTVTRMRPYIDRMPVIILTSIEDDELGRRAVQMGADYYMGKSDINGYTLGRTIIFAMERKQLIASIRALSLTDELTGLYNRRGLGLLAEQQMRMSQRKRTPFFLLFVDIDGLKAANENFGHSAGDTLIVNTAHALRETFPEPDIVARIGGDEFIILLIDGQSDLSPIRQRLANNIETIVQTAYPATVTVSIGASRFNPDKPVSLTELISEADSALYNEKHQKMPNTQVFNVYRGGAVDKA
ncbi:MAG: diguanylate cyclase [Spirochaetes bacterium]|nr:diguanylate cyclase [Spirochaetota bacterium]